jgi:uncharacterized protein YdeI (YjbR/CyaY-like superfamily)
VTEKILAAIFKQAGKDKGHIRVKGTINENNYTQTLVKYSGLWRLYINTTMLKNSPKRIGEQVKLSIEFDSEEPKQASHPDFEKALKKNKKAAAVFNSLSPSRQHEIIRYIAGLKTEESVKRNILKAIDFLLGKGNFVGRAQP